jgi:hypothetical protein
MKSAPMRLPTYGEYSMTFQPDPIGVRVRLAGAFRLLLAIGIVAVLLSPIVWSVHAHIVVPSAEVTVASEVCGKQTSGEARIQCMRGVLAQRSVSSDLARQ